MVECFAPMATQAVAIAKTINCMINRRNVRFGITTVHHSRTFRIVWPSFAVERLLPRWYFFSNAWKNIGPLWRTSTKLIFSKVTRTTVERCRWPTQVCVFACTYKLLFVLLLHRKHYWVCHSFPVGLDDGLSYGSPHATGARRRFTFEREPSARTTLFGRIFRRFRAILLCHNITHVHRHRCGSLVHRGQWRDVRRLRSTCLRHIIDHWVMIFVIVNFC